MRALLLVALLAGCAPTYRATAWDNRSHECDQLDQGGGRFATEFCRDGKGALVWIVWPV